MWIILRNLQKISRNALRFTKIFLAGKTDLTEVKAFEELPENAKKLCKRLEELMKVPINYISVGPGRAQTFKKE